VLNLALFLYYPSLQTVTLSLFNKRAPLPQEKFICLANYARLVNDTIYQNSFTTSFILTIIVVILSLSLALAIAMLASQKIRFASVYRTFLIFPFALSPVVAGAIFLAMFREGQTGLINALIFKITGTTLSWLRDPHLARAAIVAASVWNILGFNVLFYIAGLQNVPQDLLEAAQIDGANRVQRFVYVTLPLLAPFTFFLLVTNVTYSFYGIYGVIDTLTGGGPPLGAAGAAGGATKVLIYKLYEDAFNPGSPAGLAAAQAVILFIIVAGITLLQFRTLESRITYSE
jgi:sn-glycerol 3-phosphate transport system permease protein